MPAVKRLLIFDNLDGKMDFPEASRSIASWGHQIKSDQLYTFAERWWIYVGSSSGPWRKHDGFYYSPQAQLARQVIPIESWREEMYVPAHEPGEHKYHFTRGHGFDLEGQRWVFTGGRAEVIQPCFTREKAPQTIYELIPTILEGQAFCISCGQRRIEARSLLGYAVKCAWNTNVLIGTGDIPGEHCYVQQVAPKEFVHWSNLRVKRPEAGGACQFTLF